MPLIAIPAVFDGKTITFSETVPYHEPYRVLVVFVEPVPATLDSAAETFEASFGAWQQDPDEEDLMEVIRADRRSHSAPPNL
jgi:hypothetical protein